MSHTSPTPTEYIQHHLKHWSLTLYGQEGSFWTINVDTILISVLLGLLFVIPFMRCSKHASVSQPGRFQVGLEMLIEFIESQVEETLSERVSSVGALGLTLFVYIFLMNFMDLVPVDLLPVIASNMGVEYFRAVPTADLNATVGLALFVFISIYAYGIKFNGFMGWIKEVATEPFGAYLMPVNILKHLIADIARPISLSLRLFGNLYAGEIIFILIALTPAYMQWLLAGAWLGFHLFVITVQAFIFMILAIVYIGLVKHTGDDH